MPSKRMHLEFDEYLKDHGIIHGYTYANSVHDRMERGIIVWGSEHRDIDFYHSEEINREWLRGFSHLAYQETLTDYLRVALGHSALDATASRYEFEVLLSLWVTGNPVNHWVMDTDKNWLMSWQSCQSSHIYSLTN